jgi:hypothetical protein
MTGAGKGCCSSLRQELMQQADTVALATTGSGFHLLPAEPLEPVGLTDVFDDGVQAFEPFWMPGHDFLRLRAHL